MERRYNPDSIFRKPAAPGSTPQEKTTSFIIPRPVGIVSLLKDAPVAEADLISRTSTKKNELADPTDTPEKDESWEAYVARLAKIGKSPSYRTLGEVVSKRPDLKGGSWDLFRAAHERTPVSSTGATPSSSPATEPKEKV